MIKDSGDSPLLAVENEVSNDFEPEEPMEIARFGLPVAAPSNAPLALDDGAGESDVSDDPLPDVIPFPARGVPVVADLAVVHDELLQNRIAKLREQYDVYKAAGLPDVVEGISISHEVRLHGAASDVYIRFRCACPRDDHEACSKSRSVTFTTNFGPREIHCFFGAWIKAAGNYDIRKEHADFKPSLEEVATWLREHDMLE